MSQVIVTVDTRRWQTSLDLGKETRRFLTTLAVPGRRGSIAKLRLPDWI